MNQEQQAGKLHQTLAEQFTAIDRSTNPLTYLSQQFTASTFSGDRQHLAQQFTASTFR